jgi:hypothetical protein
MKTAIHYQKKEFEDKANSLENSSDWEIFYSGDITILKKSQKN